MAGADGATQRDLEQLTGLVAAGRVLVLSGAGMSTGSGIPDYRGPTGALRRHTPMTYQEFIGDREARRRYWARGFVGWRQVAAARPNPAHEAVAALQERGLVGTVVTQNVDGLHQAAGSPLVVELHGALDRVVCLDCGALLPRAQLDRRLRAANAEFDARAAELVAGRQVNPDGDVELPEDVVRCFQVVPCPVCEGGVLKPDVVFFGESVPRERVRRCFDLLASARSLLVLGSSLTVMSGYRFVRAAAKAGQPVAVVNAGATRGDGEASLKVDAPLAPTLQAVLAALDGSGAEGGGAVEGGEAVEGGRGVGRPGRGAVLAG
ncbi:NAD-dependent protein deacetylase [Quadrisphaera sp. DSM 44207]|uniref:NAD-dependent protein deacetylase n=1 Tax=Quadrisphaera sp. DSM 44207 TaxID=1881057 RepID=UPI0008870FE8|nr:NAD-dependent protein deacetylase [Quadrisphaera sp. DSM 44207]SDQ37491.1 NAD-dependent protein deacetylase, SIR2 family [Quadrisphaera sp. DSM 44207]